ncbi:MAG: ATP-dependent DNA helicase UvrD2 [Candidatus Woesearchaeota archaeon]
MREDYLKILKLFDVLPFPLGIKNLVCFLQGKENKSMIKNSLHLMPEFGCLSYLDEKSIKDIVDNLKINGFLELVPLEQNHFIKVIQITSLGKQELKEPTLIDKSFNYDEYDTVVSDNDKKKFEALGDYLNYYNDKQKLAIIESSNNILCIAGAGTGKTSVLTKRIEFLIKYKSVNPTKILAITFTRKAKEHMTLKLREFGIFNVQVETFNSFAEKILRKHENKIYGKQIKVISYSDKLRIVNLALNSMNLDRYGALNNYFDLKQKRGKTNEELFKIFVSDCFFVVDYFKYKNLELNQSSFFISKEHKHATNLVFGVCKFITAYMKKNGLRDFTDQIVDTISFFKEHKEHIPLFEHVLIDEYQDINSAQIELIDLLESKNLFVVGDPRQSIYGWRGSDIKYILNFQTKYDAVKIITLTKNYRSTMFILDLINKQIKSMGLSDLEYDRVGNNNILIKKFTGIEKEYDFVSKKILKFIGSVDKIFVIARTNYELREFEVYLKKYGIFYGKKTEFEDTSSSKKVTIATIHAIKGLEADVVFVIGCNNSHFPCISSEHPIISLIKINEYDREDEERRLLYVALSRAKDHLFITHTGRLTKYLDSDDGADVKRVVKDVFKNADLDVVNSLKEWRSEKAKKLKIPAYLILSNATLEEIALNMPITSYALEEVKGMGKVKVRRYGEEILKIVNQY